MWPRTVTVKHWPCCGLPNIIRAFGKYHNGIWVPALAVSQRYWASLEMRPRSHVWHYPAFKVPTCLWYQFKVHSWPLWTLAWCKMFNPFKKKVIQLQVSRVQISRRQHKKIQPDQVFFSHLIDTLLIKIKHESLNEVEMLLKCLQNSCHVEHRLETCMSKQFRYRNAI